MQDFGHFGEACLALVLDGSSGVEDTRAEQCVEGLGVLASDAVFVDHEMGEERLVEQSALLGVGGQVSGVAVLSEAQCRGEVGFDLIEHRSGRVQAFLDGCELRADRLLLAGDEIYGHRAAVDGLNQFLTF